VARHAQTCQHASFIEAIEWHDPEKDVRVYDCPCCDQGWLKDQEVITPPSLSMYAAATVLLEELKRAVDSPLDGTGRVNKVLSFSDSRQQAAVIASRLQRTNEDFTFRQIMFQALQEGAITTKQLISAIRERIRTTP
jgi:hypothetical protein